MSRNLRFTEEEFAAKLGERNHRRWAEQEAKADAATREGAGGPPTAVTSATPIYPLVGLCKASGLPEPIPEFHFADCIGRKWRADYAWPMHKLLLECDGGLWVQGRHSRGTGRLADMEKLSEAAILGYRVIYTTPDDMKSGAVMDRVIRALRK